VSLLDRKWSNSQKRVLESAEGSFAFEAEEFL
jgi:hypothetical protein